MSCKAVENVGARGVSGPYALSGLGAGIFDMLFNAGASAATTFDHNAETFATQQALEARSRRTTTFLAVGAGIAGLAGIVYLLARR